MSTNGQGATPTEISLEYTPGTGATFPSTLFPSAAVTSGLQNAATSVNGQTGPVTIEGGTNSQGGTVAVTNKQNAAGTIDLDVTVAVLIVSALPSAPYTGQLVFNTTSSRLVLWNGAAWVGVGLS